MLSKRMTAKSREEKPTIHARPKMMKVSKLLEPAAFNKTFLPLCTEAAEGAATLLLVEEDDAIGKKK